jgi:predicted regulator of amino acid metabolism with ACT domain
MKQLVKSILKKFWTLPKWMSLSKIFSQIGELITNQKNKKIQEVQLQRDQNKAFIAYEKISKTIESVIHEEQLKICIDMINNCCHVLNIALFLKLHRELDLKQKSLNQSFNS